VAFPFATKDGFTTGVHVSSAAGPVLQTGFDYMLTPNWGFSADVKKTFTYVESNAEGINVPGAGSFPVACYQHTHFQPWIFSVSIVYAFGKDGKILPTF
jgi:outer membrane protein W